MQVLFRPCFSLLHAQSFSISVELTQIRCCMMTQEGCSRVSRYAYNLLAGSTRQLCRFCVPLIFLPHGQRFC